MTPSRRLLVLVVTLPALRCDCSSLGLGPPSDTTGGTGGAATTDDMQTGAPQTTDASETTGPVSGTMTDAAATGALTTTSDGATGPEGTSTVETTSGAQTGTGASTTGTTGDAAFCGNGVIEDDAGEECDGAANCTADCKLAFCSNAIPEPGEQCDDGNAIDDDECSNMCTLPGCGDGILQRGEACDDGNAVDDDDCSDACTLPACGDGIVQAGAGEACDAGAANGQGACSEACQVVPTETLVLEQVGLNLAVPDDAYDGKIGSMACKEFVIAADGIDIVESMKIELAISTTYVGDLTVKIVSPNAQVLTVLSRPGPEPQPLADNGVPCCGDSSNLDPAFPITLLDGAMVSGKLMGSAIGNAQAICKDDALCDFAPYPGAGPGTNFADFAGDLAPGSWSVCFGDSSSGDLAVVHEIRWTIDKVL